MNIIPTAAFLKRHLKACKSWSLGRRSRENMLMWLAWHSAKYHIAQVEHEGKIVAVGVARSIVKEEDSHSPFVSVEGAPILFVEQVAVKDPSSAVGRDRLKLLLKYTKDRWPNTKQILFHRSKANGKSLKMYDYQQFLAKAGVA